MAGLTSIDGLVSGLKTGDIIDSLIALERRPAVLMEQEQAEKTNIVSALKALQAKLLAMASDVNALTRRATFETASVKVSDDAILSATASGRGVAGSYDLQVLSLARNHQIASQGFSSQSLAQFGAGTITIAVGNGSAKTITVDSGNNSLTGIKKAINDAQIGVTASIINDGSTSAPYRLVLTSDKPGAAKSIKVSASLSGGQTLNYSTAVFDAPEWIAKNSSSTSQISLGPTASYTGTTNKIYSFTVAGTGTKTVGTDVVTLNWTDGTNSGSVVVTQADSEVDLAVPGAQGLKLNFSAGKLVGGDSFKVQTFAPLLQAASDAKVTVGSTGGSGSPIIITSATNNLTDIIPGLKLSLKKETLPGATVTVTTDVDVSAIKDKITAFIKSYNDVNDYIDKQNRYDKDTTQTGVLFGDSSIQRLQNSVAQAASSTISGLTGKYNQLAAVGVRIGLDGRLSLRDPVKLEDALRTNPTAVVDLFTNAGTTTSDKIEFVSLTDKTKAGQKYAVDIVSAATQGQFQGANFTDPASVPLILTSTNNRLKLNLNGTESEEIVLEAKTYGSSAELIAELQAKIDNDSKIGGLGLTVSWVSNTDTTGHLVLQSSTYGAASKVNIVTSIPNSAFNALGLKQGQSIIGRDVQGTINGEAAEGIGQYLTGKSGNKTTDGLKLKITYTSSQAHSGVEGSISVTKGIASRMSETLDSINRAGNGLLDSRIASYQKQVDSIKTRITDFDAFLAIRREDLTRRYAALEQTLSQLNSANTSLTNSLNGLTWGYTGQKSQ